MPKGNPRERAAAIAAGAKTYFTGKPCPCGHVAERRTACGGCMECQRVRARKRMREKLKDPEAKAKHYTQVLARKRERYATDPEYRKRRLDEWRRANAARPREEKRAYMREYFARSPSALLRQRIGAALWHQMKGHKKGRSVMEFVGCTIEELRARIEDQFEPGMTWENYGKRWHIDHVLPCSLFDHTKDEEVRMCWHYSNLQPLWAEENQAKSDRVSPGVMLAVQRMKERAMEVKGCLAS
jgi:hypothetical protein